MTEKQLIKKIKDYLESDATSDVDENYKIYAEQLLNWISKWQKEDYTK